MIKVYEVILVVRNARDKIQIAHYQMEQEANTYTIKRFTGQFEGKMTEQPSIIIERGKAKRSVLQQAELEYNSLIKKALDKGYKKLSDLTKTKYESITALELDQIVPKLKTDSNGNIKPQLAKSYTDCTVNIFKKPLYCSRKLDGVRCLMKFDNVEQEVKSVSRGGGEYDIPTTHIRNNSLFKSMFKENLNTIFDGELYIHGWPLQKISGTARLKTFEERCEKLEYWIYDIVDESKTFEERLEYLEYMKDLFEDHPTIKIVDHILLEGWVDIKKYHDKFVSEGFEGLVARKPDKKYSPGKRNSDWIKVKDYKDDEFEIIGISDGLRPEDMCFVLKTNNGKEFKAKPIGNRELKYDYLENWESYIGKMATVKFFNYSVDGVPTQPTLKNIREEGE